MRGSRNNYVDFSGGLNLQGAPYLIQENQAREALNVHTTSTGTLTKRRGFVALASSIGVTPTSLFPANVATPILLMAGGIKLYSITTDGTATELTTGLTSGLMWNWVQAPTSGGQGPIYGCNGTDTPRYWDGTSASTATWTASTGTVPVAKYFAYHGTRIWAAGVSANPSRLYYSGLSGSAPDPRSWDASNFVDLEPNDGQSITGLGVVGPYLIVFKPRKTFVITDLVTGANRKISDEVGCISHRSIVDSDKGCLFLSSDQGVMVTRGEQIEHISDQIDPIITQAQTSVSQMSKAAGAFLDGNYYLSLSTNGTANNRVLHYDTVTKSWWTHDQASNQFALLDPSGTPVLYSADPSSQRVHKAFVSDVYADNGAAYSGGAYWTSPHYVWGDPHIVKRIRQGRIDGSGTWDFSYATDFGSTFTNADGVTWQSTDTGSTFGGSGLFGGAGTFGPAAGISQIRYPTLGAARAWSFRIRSTDTSDLDIYSLVLATVQRQD